MKRFADFMINVALNLVLGYVWLIAIGIAVVLHFVIGLPLTFAGGIFLVYLVITVLETAGLRFIGSIPTKQPEQKNVNPYTKSNDDFPPLKK